MIVTRLKLPLEQAEYSALLILAGSELRNPTDQARIILRDELVRRGLFPREKEIASSGSLEPDGEQKVQPISY
jgi:hypothetical protein